MDLNKKYPLEFCINDLGYVGFGGYEYEGPGKEKFWVVQVESDSSYGFNYILLKSILDKMGYVIMRSEEYVEEDTDFVYIDHYTNIPAKVYWDLFHGDDEEE